MLAIRTTTRAEQSSRGDIGGDDSVEPHCEVALNDWTRDDTNDELDVATECNANTICVAQRVNASEMDDRVGDEDDSDSGRCTDHTFAGAEATGVTDYRSGQWAALGVPTVCLRLAHRRWKLPDGQTR